MLENTLKQTLEKGKTSTIEEQITFLHNVMFDQKEYDQLLEDPEGYCSRQVPPITLDLGVVEKVQQIIMHDVAIDACFDELCPAIKKPLPEIVLQRPKILQLLLDRSKILLPNCTMKDVLRSKIERAVLTKEIAASVIKGINTKQ